MSLMLSNLSEASNIKQNPAPILETIVPSPAKKNSSEIKAQLKESEHVKLNFLDSGFDIVTPNYDYLAQIPEDLQEKFKLYIEVLNNFLQNNLYTDNFETHQERRLWRLKKAPEIRVFLESNRLRAGLLGKARIALEMLIYDYLAEQKNFSPQLAQLENLAEPISELIKKLTFPNPSGEKFDLLSLEQKLDLVEKTTQLSIKILEIFGFTVNRKVNKLTN